MKRSQINKALEDALRCFEAAQWALPPNPRWDVTDCGLGRFNEVGLVLVNLTEQPEYCEKLMYSKDRQVYVDPHIGRFPGIEEDEAPTTRLVWEPGK